MPISLFVPCEGSGVYVHIYAHVYMYMYMCMRGHELGSVLSPVVEHRCRAVSREYDPCSEAVRVTGLCEIDRHRDSACVCVRVCVCVCACVCMYAICTYVMNTCDLCEQNVP